MKKVFFVLATLAVIVAQTACHKTDQVLVRFQNDTNLELKDVVMDFYEDSTAVGLIAPQSTTPYMAFDYFMAGHYGSGEPEYPMGALKGQSEGAAIQIGNMLFCGTGLETKQLEPGQYTVVIEVAGNFEGKDYYLIRFAD